MVENARNKVWKELARTIGAEAEATGSTTAKEAFLGMFKSKMDLLNVAEEKESALREEL